MPLVLLLLETLGPFGLEEATQLKQPWQLQAKGGHTRIAAAANTAPRLSLTVGMALMVRLGRVTPGEVHGTVGQIQDPMTMPMWR